ncbi:hypothetical protein [Limnovirga soli]|uniref:Uncharacterized protein n=1 Tax=Limnovirga soli TaxID=2656915 RepID=A0A8J8FD79_9BACT|nr:hypothetical protein [Limnovirga soli]NNV54532.1 hypothetical protein [Limnovirga soli]
MKSLKAVLSVVFALLFAMFFGNLFADYVGVSPLLPTLAIVAFSFAAGATRYNDGALRDGVYTEIWLGELVKRFRFKREWLSLIPRYDNAVKNKVIHLVDVGADPEVYIDLVIDAENPVPTTTRTDSDIPISLNRYDSANTMISLTELRAISYDKMGLTLDLHMNSIADKAARRAAWNLAATTAGNIIPTTGASDGRTVAKKRLTPDDLVNLGEIVSTSFQEGGPDWPEGEGVAVLDHRHIADMQKLDEKFDRQWKNAQTGELFPYCGWKIMKFNNNAKYTFGAGVYTRKAFDAAADAANDLHSSLFFLPQRAFAAADNTPEMFYRMASQDPELRSNTVGFRHWNIIAKKKVDGFYSLVSPKIA